MEYTVDSVLLECTTVREQIKKKKDRAILDKRNYLIALLYFKYSWSETKIAALFEMDRSTVNYSKYLANQFITINDISFIANVNDLHLSFPYDFPDRQNQKLITRLNVVNIRLHNDVYKKLNNYAKVNGLKIDQAAASLLIKAIKVWDE
jgi:hypothetical protein